MIKCVIHDFDGTLSDSMNAVYKSYSIILNKPLDYVIENYDPDWKAYLKREGVEDPGKDVWKNLIESFGTKLFNEVKKYLEMLKKDGFDIAIVTSSQINLVNSQLKKCNIENMFKKIVSVEDVKKLKPDPEGLLLAIELLGADLEDCVYVGDTDADAMAAKRAGMKFIGVGWGCQKPDMIRKVNNDIVVSNFSELHDAIKSL